MAVVDFSIEYDTQSSGGPGATLVYNGVNLDLGITDRDEIVTLFSGVSDFLWVSPFFKGYIVHAIDNKTEYFTTQQEAYELGADVIRVCENLVNPQKQKAEYQNRDDIQYAGVRPDWELSDKNYELSKPEQYRLIDRYFCFTKNNTLSEAAVLPEENQEIVARTKLFKHCPGQILNLKQKRKIDPIKYEENSAVEVDANTQPKAHGWLTRYGLNHLAGWHYQSGKLIPRDNIFFYGVSARGSIVTVRKIIVCFAKMDQETHLEDFLQDMTEKDLESGVLDAGLVYRFLFLVEPGGLAWNEIIGSDEDVIDENRILSWQYNAETKSLTSG